MNTLIANGKHVSDDASKVCVLYDPKDGRVVHVHGVTVLHSGGGVGAAELEARARRLAEHFGKPTAGLRALHVPIADIRNQGRLRVNQSRNGLEPATPRPRRSR